MRNLTISLILAAASAFGQGVVLPPPTSNQTAVTQWSYNPALTNVDYNGMNATGIVAVIGTNGLSIDLNTGELGGAWPIETQLSGTSNTLYSIATNKAAASFTDNMPAMFLPVGSLSFMNSGRGHNSTVHRTDIMGTNYQFALLGLYAVSRDTYPDANYYSGLEMWQYANATSTTGWMVGANSPFLSGGLHDGGGYAIQWRIFGTAVTTNTHSMTLQVYSNNAPRTYMVIDGESGRMTVQGSAEFKGGIIAPDIYNMTNIPTNVIARVNDSAPTPRRFQVIGTNNQMAVMGWAAGEPFFQLYNGVSASGPTIGLTPGGTNFVVYPGDGSALSYELFHAGNSPGYNAGSMTNFPASLQTVAAFNLWSTNAGKIITGTVPSNTSHNIGNIVLGTTNVWFYYPNGGGTGTNYGRADLKWNW